MFSLKITPSFKIFYSIFFISGFCSLAYELIWIKMFIPIFGVSIYSISAVVSSFMGGLALGSYICGKIIDYKNNLLKYYGFFEFFIGIYAIILPFLININLTTIPFSIIMFSSNFYILSVLRFIFAFLLLIIPCSLMGATLPLMSRFFIISSRGTTEKDFGILYALNTFGAVCGCLIVTFFMLEYFGIVISSYMIATINIAIGILIYHYSLSNKSDYLNTPKSCLTKPKDEKTSRPPPNPKNILFFAFLCGFCTLSFEILLIRILITLLPNDVYSFPTVLMTILMATSLGSFLNSSFCIAKFKNYSFMLGISMVISGFMFAITIRYIPFQLVKLSYSYWHLWWYISIVCLSMIFPATFFMGITFPNLVALYSNGIKSIGHDVGNVFSMNTLGAVLGIFLTSFISIPFLGLRNTFLVCLILYTLAGEFIFVRALRKTKNIAILISVIFLTTLLLLYKLMPINLIRDIFVANVKNVNIKGDLVLYKEGAVCSMGVFKRNDVFCIQYSDLTTVGAEVLQTGTRRSTYRLQAHIPTILHNNPHAVLNIGFGTGISTYSLALHNIDRIDNVEICAETMDASKFFIDNQNIIFNNPRNHIIVDDGRNFLFLTKEKYDIIFVYSFSPLGNENIFFYTKDFLQLCKKKLNPGGLISIWFPVQEIGRNESLILLKTFLETFPNSTLFSTFPVSSYDDVAYGGFLIGTIDEDGLPLSINYLTDKLQSLNPEVKTELMLSNINNAQDLLNRRVVSSNNLTALCGSIKEVITDNQTILDYRTAKQKWFQATNKRWDKNPRFRKDFHTHFKEIIK